PGARSHRSRELVALQLEPNQGHPRFAVGADRVLPCAGRVSAVDTHSLPGPSLGQGIASEPDLSLDGVSAQFSRIGEGAKASPNLEGNRSVLAVALRNWRFKAG